MAGAAILNYVNMHFWCNSYVLDQIFNTTTKIGGDRSNSNKMATDFLYSRWRPPPSWIFVNMYFWCNICVLGKNLNILTKFGEDRSNSNEMATEFWNSKWRAPPSWITWICIFVAKVKFKVRFSTFSPNLVGIGPIVMKWQPVFEIQDGDRSSPNLVRMLRIWPWT